MFQAQNVGAGKLNKSSIQWKGKVSEAFLHALLIKCGLVFIQVTETDRHIL